VDQELKVELSFSNEDVKETIDGLIVAGGKNVKEVRELGMTGIELTVVAVMAMQALVSAVVKLTQLWKCGLVVDARGSKVIVTKNCDLQPSAVLILSKDGTQVKLDRPTGFDLDAAIQRATAAVKGR